jgi:hypothetical protein
VLGTAGIRVVPVAVVVQAVQRLLRSLYARPLSAHVVVFDARVLDAERRTAAGTSRHRGIKSNSSGNSGNSSNSSNSVVVISGSTVTRNYKDLSPFSDDGHGQSNIGGQSKQRRQQETGEAVQR